ncbi:MAG: hypothetical protein AAFV07_09510, partial [Bacteroidota bacterium]
YRFDVMPVINAAGYVQVGTSVMLFDAEMGQLISLEGDVEKLAFVAETQRPVEGILISNPAKDADLSLRNCGYTTRSAQATKSGPNRRIVYTLGLNPKTIVADGTDPFTGVQLYRIRFGYFSQTESFKGGNNGYRTRHYWDEDFGVTCFNANCVVAAVNRNGQSPNEGRVFLNFVVNAGDYRGVEWADRNTYDVFFDYINDRTGGSHRGMDASLPQRWATIASCN